MNKLTPNLLLPSNATLMWLLMLLLGARRSVLGDGASEGTICTSDTNTFTVKVNPYAGEMGYYYFDECGEVTNPTIGLEIGQTYTFNQEDVSNFYHPLGFAYFPDGAHASKPELEPTVSNAPNGDCASTMTCPAPMYYVGDDYLGKYSNLPEVGVTENESDFGLGKYEPHFIYPLEEWASFNKYGGFNVKLRFDDFNYEKDLFYFCHIHEFMSARIKLLKGGVPVNPIDSPPLGYEYDQPGPFDKKCGTYDLDAFQTPGNSQCPSTFVCGVDELDSQESVQFADCINAMNCHMFAGMTTGVTDNSPVALFIHQMIPHHQNAVNMAKALLKTGKAPCDDITDTEDQSCTLQSILREIINNQNMQIQQMQGVLDSLEYPEFNDCVVEIKTIDSVS